MRQQVGSRLIVCGFGDREHAARGACHCLVAGNLFRLMTPQQQRNLCDNLAGPLSQVDAATLQRQLAHFDRADPAYGAGVRAALADRQEA